MLLEDGMWARKGYSSFKSKKPSASYTTSYLHLNELNKICKVLLKGQVGSQSHFPFRLYGNQFYLITQLSQPAFFYCLKRNTETYKLTNWWGEQFICSASEGSEWPVLAIWGRCTNHAAVSSCGADFPWKGVLLSLEQDALCAAPSHRFKQALALCGDCQLFVTPRSQLSTLQDSKLFPPPLRLRTGGKRGLQLSLPLLLLPAGGEFSFVTYPYSGLLFIHFYTF